MIEVWNAGTIYNLRLSRRQTQAEFAADMDTDRETVSRWERGESKPNMANMRKLDSLAAARTFTYTPESESE